MMFCPKCGSLLRPKVDKKKKVMACTCGYTSKEASSTTISETIVRDDKKITVVDEKDDSLPVTDAECPECGNSKAYYWLAQTRSSDEGETKFLKCTKCTHTWRDYN